MPFAFLSAACSQPSQLTLRSSKQNVEFSQTFKHAYAGRGEAGEETFVLATDNPARVSGSGDEKTPPRESLQQVVYIKVLWRTINGIDRTAPTANAAIDWYVLTDSAAAPAGTSGVLQYQGAGMVDVSSDGGGKTVTIRNATLKPQAACGNVTDPVGTSKLLGQFHARSNPAKVRELLEATRARTAAAMEAETASASTR